MSKYYLAVDLGASSGRLILGHIDQGQLRLEEVCRFENGMTRQDGHLCWDYDVIFGHIKDGLKQCAQEGHIPVSMSVDTWGVDFVLLDQNNNVLGQTVGYRDERTEGMDREVEKILSKEELYARTGTLKAIYNSIYQLMALKKENENGANAFAPETSPLNSTILDHARTFLMVPDYFHFLLTGRKGTEYSEASTSGLTNPKNKDWDYELIDQLDLPKDIFRKPVPAGSTIGKLRESLCEEIGYDLKVVAACTHDTQSAIVALPIKPANAPASGSVHSPATAGGQAQPQSITGSTDSTLYISSGTWSLMGVERMEADCSARSAQLNFTNEWGYGGNICYLQNIMGLWMIQSLRHEFDDKYSWDEICAQAESCKDFPSIVAAGDDSFLSPKSMKAAVQEYCHKTGQPIPETLGELAHVIYASLAACYAKNADLLEEMTGQKYGSIYIVGGGSKADYLNRLTAEKSGRTVYAGPAEATAIGNILVQMIADGEVESLEKGRELICNSFVIKKYE